MRNDSPDLFLGVRSILEKKTLLPGYRMTAPPPPTFPRLIVIKYDYKISYVSDEKRPRTLYERTGEKALRIKVGENMKQRIDGYINDAIEDVTTESPIIYKRGSMKWRVVSDVEIKPKPTKKLTHLAKIATALDLDGRPIQHWDTKKGTCVYDFLIWRYSGVKGCKKICTYDNLDLLFKGYGYRNRMPIRKDDIATYSERTDITIYDKETDEPFYMFNHIEPYNDSNPREDGVCIHQLEAFCDSAGCTMYAMDEMEKLIHTYKPTKENHSAPPLIFQIKDNHFYAITNHNMSISRMGKRKTVLNKADDIKEEVAKAPEEIVVLDRPIGTTSVELMVKQMKEIGKQVYPFKNIQMSEKGLKGFVLDGMRYLFEEDHSIATAKKIAEINKQPYTGDSVFTILYKLLAEHKYTEKSILNPFMFQLLTSDGVKWRQHYGATTEVKDLSGLVCADISKCYTSIIASPICPSGWLQFDFNDSFVPYDNEPISPGLYYVETDDQTLMHCTNIYSHTMVRKALAMRIDIKIVARCIPTRPSLRPNYFEKLLTGIDTVCKGDKELKKVLTNTITGLLGKHKTDKYVCKMNSDPADVWHDFSKPEFHNNKTFMHKVEEIYVYGYIMEIVHVENNIPMYIQILDQANIALYNMVKKSGGTCLWRKTDCALLKDVRKTFLTLIHKKGSTPGSYRHCDAPELNEDGKLTLQATPDIRGVKLKVIEAPWTDYNAISNSGQVEEVYKLLLEKKGLCNVSRAGTGKSFNLLGLEKRFKEDYPEGLVYKLAFTNRACLNIRGTTIHKFLKIDKRGRLNLDWLKTIRDRVILILIDEVSMIGTFLWRRLIELKQMLPSAYFLLCGDFRQVPPVEQLATPIDYFDSSAMKYMGGYSRIEFKVRQRYDKALWDFAELIWEKDETDFTAVHTIDGDEITPEFLDGKNVISYFNSTRKSINAMMNEYYAEKATEPIYRTMKIEGETMTIDEDSIEYALCIPYTLPDGESEKDAKQQDAVLYRNCPVFATCNKMHPDGDLLSLVNNESFTFKYMDGDQLRFESKRINDDGTEYDHLFLCSPEEFHEFFILGYCATVHKSQGATIDNDIVLFNYERMTKNLKYTAVTRAKKLSQIFIVL